MLYQLNLLVILDEMIVLRKWRNGRINFAKILCTFLLFRDEYLGIVYLRQFPHYYFINCKLKFLRYIFIRHSQFPQLI
jgi:hypothetical protein